MENHLHPVTAAKGPRIPKPEKPKTPLVVSKRLGLLNIEIASAHAALENIKAQVNAILDSGVSDQIARDEMQRLTAKRVQATGKLDALGQMRAKANDWLQRVREIEEVKVKVGPDALTDPLQLKTTIETLRNEIAAAKAELADVERAPIKIQNLEGQVRAYVAALAKIGAPPTCMIETGGLIKIDFTEAGHMKQPHVYLAWLDPDQMVKRLVAEIKERQAQNGRTPMSEDEKHERASELSAQLDKMERRDAALTVAALEAEIPGVTFRADLSIPALLGIRALREPARTALVA